MTDTEDVPMGGCHTRENSCSTDYQAVKNSGDEILRVCSYHRRNFDLVVIRSRPHELQAVYASLTTAPKPKSKPQAHLGSRLGSLPPEIMLMVILQLDIRSIFSLRQVNSFARSLITSVQEYQLTATHAPEALRALLRSGLARSHLLSNLYQALTQQQKQPLCTSCNSSFGGLLFLFTLERCCFSCLQSSTRYHVYTQSAYSKVVHVSRARLEKIPGLLLRTVPGVYDMMQNPVKRLPMYLLFEPVATAVLLMKGMISDETAQRVELREKGKEHHRFMTATAFPFYDLKSAKVDHGVYCKGCQIRFDRLREDPTDQHRCFSQEAFLTHFTECPEALQMWAESREGTRPVEEPEFTRRGGYFNVLGADGLPA